MAWEKERHWWALTGPQWSDIDQGQDQAGRCLPFRWLPQVSLPEDPMSLQESVLGTSGCGQNVNKHQALESSGR